MRLHIYLDMTALDNVVGMHNFQVKDTDTHIIARYHWVQVLFVSAITSNIVFRCKHEENTICASSNYGI